MNGIPLSTAIQLNITKRSNINGRQCIYHNPTPYHPLAIYPIDQLPVQVHHLSWNTLYSKIRGDHVAEGPISRRNICTQGAHYPD